MIRFLRFLVIANTLETARNLTALQPRAFAETKRKLRGGVADRIRVSLKADLATFVVR
ncbi:MAG: hypothetical protein GY937_13625 [bacterium]|nr:hypothetical protein [bacterium]